MKKIADSALMGAYKPSTDSNFSNEDWLFQLNFRIDNVFSNKPIKTTLVVSLYDNVALTEDPQLWPVTPLGESEFGYESVYNRYCTKLNNLYRGQLGTPRFDLSYTEGTEFARAQSFLGSL